MATANPDEAEFTCKNPDCPKGIFQQNTILNHIQKAKNCKIFYTSEEIEDLRDSSKQRQKLNMAKKRSSSSSTLQTGSNPEKNKDA